MAPLLLNLRQSLSRLLIVLPVLAALMISSPAQAAQWDTETLTVPSDSEGTVSVSASHWAA